MSDGRDVIDRLANIVGADHVLHRPPQQVCRRLTEVLQGVLAG